MAGRDQVDSGVDYGSDVHTDLGSDLHRSTNFKVSQKSTPVAAGTQGIDPPRGERPKKLQQNSRGRNRAGDRGQGMYVLFILHRVNLLKEHNKIPTIIPL